MALHGMNQPCIILAYSSTMDGGPPTYRCALIETRAAHPDAPAVSTRFEYNFQPSNGILSQRERITSYSIFFRVVLRQIAS